MNCYELEDGWLECSDPDDFFDNEDAEIKKSNVDFSELVSGMSCYDEGDGYYHCYHDYDYDYYDVATAPDPETAAFQGTFKNSDNYLQEDVETINSHSSNLTSGISNNITNLSHNETTEETALVQKNSSFSGYSHGEIITFSIAAAILPIALCVLCCAIRRRIRGNRYYGHGPTQLAVFETTAKISEGYECRALPRVAAD